MLRHRNHQLTRALAAGVVAAALAAPPAVARIDPPATPEYDLVDAAPAVSSESAPVVVRNIDDGFDWGAAAIGAGGTGALIVLASVAGASRQTRRARRRSPQAASAAGSRI